MLEEISSEVWFFDKKFYEFNNRLSAKTLLFCLNHTEQMKVQFNSNRE